MLENKEPESADIPTFASAAEQTSLYLFELYLSLHELSKYKIYVNESFVFRLFSTKIKKYFCLFSDRTNLKINVYHTYFGAAVKKWLSVARNKIRYRIERAVEKEKSETAYNIKFTPSSLDVSNCFSQISQFWRRLGMSEC